MNEFNSKILGGLLMASATSIMLGNIMGKGTSDLLTTIFREAGKLPHEIIWEPRWGGRRFKYDYNPNTGEKILLEKSQFFQYKN